MKLRKASNLKGVSAVSKKKLSAWFIAVARMLPSRHGLQPFSSRPRCPLGLLRTPAPGCWSLSPCSQRAAHEPRCWPLLICPRLQACCRCSESPCLLPLFRRQDMDAGQPTPWTTTGTFKFAAASSSSHEKSSEHHAHPLLEPQHHESLSAR